MNKKYYLDRDDDGHWYIIPLELKNQFEKFISNPSPTDDDYPKGAVRVGGSPNLVTFEHPVIS